MRGLPGLLDSLASMSGLGIFLEDDSAVVMLLLPFGASLLPLSVNVLGMRTGFDPRICFGECNSRP